MTSPELDWNPFARDNAIGDPGRQPEIKSVSGPLNVGVADTALDFLSLEGFEIRGCSTRGWSHRYKGTPRQDTPRQDSFALLTNDDVVVRSEEHTSELQSLMRTSYAVFCLKKKKQRIT